MEQISVVGLFAGGLGYPELIIIGCLALLIFGSRIPKLGGWLGQSISQFGKGVRGENEDMSEQDEAKS